MFDAFAKTVKWIIMITLIMVGCYCLLLASENNDIKPVIVSVFSFGCVYIMYRTNANAPKKIGLASAGVLVAGAVAAQYAPYDLPMLSDTFLKAWWGWTMIAGIPVMLFMYSRQ